MEATIGYVRVHPHQVSQQYRELAALAVKMASRELELDRVTLWWVRPEADHEEEDRLDWEVVRKRKDRHPGTLFKTARIGGAVRQNERDAIYISTECDPKGVVEAVFHECRHLWQMKHWGDAISYLAAGKGALYGDEEPRREEDAQAFAAAMLRALGATP